MSRLKPVEGWSSLILLALMLLTVAWSIEAANWAQGLALLQGAVLVAIAVGFALARMPIPSLVAHALGTVTGVGWSSVLVGRLLDPASIIHRAVLDESTLTWRVRFTELFFRVQRFIEIARGEGMGHDNLVFVLQLAALMWLVSYASTWSFFRSRSIWGAVVPSGFAMVLNLYYAPPDLYTWMALYLLCALLLIVRSNVLVQEEEWRRAGIGYSPDISFEFLRDGAIFALIVILLAWIAPTTSAAPHLYAIIDQVDESVYRFQREFTRLYSSLNYKPRPGPAYFGDTMTLSGAVNLGDTPIFDAVTEKGRYWRGVVYDQYTGRGWVNTATSITTLSEDDQRLGAFKFELRQPVTQTIRVLQPGTTQLHGVPQPIQVSLPARAQYSPVPETTESGVAPLNVSTIHSRRPLDTGDTYTVISSVSMADVKSLQDAGTDYPSWVKEKYLQLPDDLPKRVRDLAAKIAADRDNPYNKVSAIRDYLRQIEYDETIPAPPPGVDSVDWFLFEQQAGYCDYYASALVVMSRSLGIPARIAAGYSRGDFNPDIGAYRQREYDAHSWPEVFFPEYGWVEFEPTAADPAIVRPAAPATSSSSDDSSGDSEGSEAPSDRPLDERILLGDELRDDPFFPGLQQGRTALWLWGVFGLLTISGVAALIGFLLWRRAFRGLSLAGATYGRMIRLASWLGLPAEPSQTPHEYADRLASAMPEGRPAIGQITNAYVLEQYAEVQPSDEEAAGLRQAWLRLRRMLIEHFGLRLLQRVTGNLSRGAGVRGSRGAGVQGRKS